MNLRTFALCVVLAMPLLDGQSGEARRIDVIFTGGHDTEPRDRGRPDILIAAALGVPTDVFREAFSHVKPASGGREPEPEQVRLNHAALMSALGSYGVTNEKLNSVSNYYRYNRSKGEEVWRTTPAAAFATVRDGVVTGFTITNPGSGYSSEPRISVPGTPDIQVSVKLAFTTNFQSNGSIRELVLASAK